MNRFKERARLEKKEYDELINKKVPSAKKFFARLDQNARSLGKREAMLITLKQFGLQYDDLEKLGSHGGNNEH